MALVVATSWENLPGAQLLSCRHTFAHHHLRIEELNCDGKLHASHHASMIAAMFEMDFVEVDFEALSVQLPTGCCVSLH